MMFSRFHRSLPLVVLFAAIVAWPVAAAARSLPDFASLVEDNAQAVVNISTTQRVRPRESQQFHPRLPGVPDELMDDFLRRFFGEDAMPREFDSNSLGSGFIISTDGYVITNHHVIRDAHEIVVRLHDRREFNAEVIGSDPKTDVALIKIDGDGLPVLRLGDSTRLKVGEWVLAIGSPFGFDYSATAGIVSAKGRTLPAETYVPFIQTDVAINPGNSGGPLFNLDGEVVGINSQIYSRTGGFMGLSFAIPIEVAMDVVGQIKEKGHVSRGWLGILIQEVTRELAESFGMKEPTGALIARVLPGSPAEEAGLRPGDVILSFGKEEIPDSRTLPRISGSARPGDNVRLRVLRDGKAVTVRVKIGEMPAEDVLAADSAAPEAAPRDVSAALGLSLAPVPPELREQTGVEKGGAIAAEVRSGPAREAGIRPGDILTMIAGREVEGPQQAAEILNGIEKGRAVPVLVTRPSGPLFLSLKIPE